MIENVEDIAVFLVVKAFNSDKFNMFSCSRNVQACASHFIRESTIKINLFTKAHFIFKTENLT